MRDFLWSDGLGNKKRHCVKWEWLCLPKERGGLEIMELKAQGMALASKWTIKTQSGEEPWKFLVRNNISRSSI